MRESVPRYPCCCNIFDYRLPFGGCGKKEINISIGKVKDNGVVVCGTGQVCRMMHVELQSSGLDIVVQSGSMNIGSFSIYSAHKIGIGLGGTGISIVSYLVYFESVQDSD